MRAAMTDVERKIELTAEHRSASSIEFKKLLASVDSARLAVARRKSLSSAEVAAVQRERLPTLGKHVCSHVAENLWRLLVLAISGASFCYAGSHFDKVQILLTGYALIAALALHLCSEGDRFLSMRCEDQLTPEDLPIDRDGVGDLLRVSREDPEIMAATSTWWRLDSPIRSRGLALVRNLLSAKRDSNIFLEHVPLERKQMYMFDESARSGVDRSFLAIPSERSNKR